MAELGPTGGGWKIEPGSLDFPLVIAHRGDHAEAPENTLDAFCRAVALGADGVELDVRLTRDRQIAVVHDRRIGGTGARRAAVGRLTLGEINELLSRSSSGPTQTKVPTLDEVFDHLSPSLLVDVELKVRGPGVNALVSRVVDAVRRFGRFGSTLVTSYNPVALWLLRKTEPRIPRGYVWGRSHPWPLRARWVSTAPNAQWSAPSQNSLDTELLERCHRLGRGVLAWDVDVVGDLDRFVEAGLDAIVTDDPASLVDRRKKGA